MAGNPLVGANFVKAVVSIAPCANKIVDIARMRRSETKKAVKKSEHINQGTHSLFILGKLFDPVSKAKFS